MEQSKQDFIKDVKEGTQIKSFFLLSQKKTSKTRSGSPYMDLQLQDKTGTLPAKVWDVVSGIEDLVTTNDYVFIEGSVESYNGSLQIRVSHLEKVDSAKLNIEDYVPASEKPAEEMKQNLRKILITIKNPFLLKLIGLFWNDIEFMDKFCTWPAAMKMHHAYMYGLLEHTLSVVENCQFFISKYQNEEIRGCLLLAAAFLHDIGKIVELNAGPSISYTDSGHLLGHITIGIRLVRKKIDMIQDFPEKLAVQLEHILISHHGELSFGSPKVPMSLEAFILHHADNIDAKVSMVRNMEHEGRKRGERFMYSRPLERYIWVNTESYDE